MINRYLFGEDIFRQTGSYAISPISCLEIMRIASAFQNIELREKAFSLLQSTILAVPERWFFEIARIFVSCSDLELPELLPTKELCSILSREERGQLFRERVIPCAISNRKSAHEEIVRIRYSPCTVTSEIVKKFWGKGGAEDLFVQECMKQKQLCLSIAYDDCEIDDTCQFLERHHESIRDVRLYAKGVRLIRDPLVSWVKLYSMPYTSDEYRKQVCAILCEEMFLPKHAVHMYAIGVYREYCPSKITHDVQGLCKMLRSLQGKLLQIPFEVWSMIMNYLPSYIPPLFFFEDLLDDEVCSGTVRLLERNPEEFFSHLQRALCDTQRPFNQLVAHAIVMAMWNVQHETSGFIPVFKQLFSEIRYQRMANLLTGSDQQLLQLQHCFQPAPNSHELHGALMRVPIYAAYSNAMSTQNGTVPFSSTVAMSRRPLHSFFINQAVFRPLSP